MDTESFQAYTHIEQQQPYNNNMGERCGESDEDEGGKEGIFICHYEGRSACEHCS